MAVRHFVTLQARGLLALPAELRRRHRLDEPGAHVELVEREDGVIELHPRASIPVSQTWYWTERWQAMEREADEAIARGEVTTYDSAEDFIAYLDEALAEKE
jgi:bifunctional DNA-binding transcriptional regulator/antitoxin component of YhaV-PrlF toxin-antitoxin module